MAQNNDELLLQIAQLTLQNNALLNELLSVVKPTHNPAKPTAKPALQLINYKQASMLFATSESHDVPREELKKLLHKYDCPSGYTQDFPLKHIAPLHKELIELAQKHNEFYPTPKYTKVGAINPEWASLNEQAKTI
jgi:hypothetical protein